MAVAASLRLEQRRRIVLGFDTAYQWATLAQDTMTARGMREHPAHDAGAGHSGSFQRFLQVLSNLIKDIPAVLF